MIVALGSADLACVRTGWSQDTMLLLALAETAVVMLAAAMYLTAHRTSRKLESFERWIDSLENVAFIAIGRGGEIRTWTPGAAIVTGFQPPEVMGKTFDCLFSGEDREAGIPSNLLRIAAGNGSCEHEGWASRPDGTRYWARFLMTAVRGELRFLRGFSIVIHDETTRKLTDDHISDQRQLLETVVNGTFDIIFLKDRDGRYKLMNAAGALAFRRRRDEIEGVTDRELFDPAEYQQQLDSDRAVMESGDARVYEEDVALGDTPRVYLTHKTPWRDHEGKVIGIIGIATDITERKRREEIDRSLAEYRNLFVEAPVAYHELDRNGVIRNVNRVECELLGREPSEMIGKPIWRFVAPQERSDAVAHMHSKLAGNEDPVPFERTYVRPDGTPVRVAIHESRILDAHGNAVGIRSALVAAQTEPPLERNTGLAVPEDIAAVC